MPAATYLRTMAKRYLDTSDLGANCWGWRDIAACLERAADEAEKQDAAQVEQLRAENAALATERASWESALMETLEMERGYFNDRERALEHTIRDQRAVVEAAKRWRESGEGTIDATTEAIDALIVAVDALSPREPPRSSTSRCTCDTEADPNCRRHSRLAPPRGATAGGGDVAAVRRLRADGLHTVSGVSPRALSPAYRDHCILDLDSPSYPPEADEYRQCGCANCSPRASPPPEEASGEVVFDVPLQRRSLSCPNCAALAARLGAAEKALVEWERVHDEAMEHKLVVHIWLAVLIGQAAECTKKWRETIASTSTKKENPVHEDR